MPLYLTVWCPGAGLGIEIKTDALENDLKFLLILADWQWHELVGVWWQGGVVEGYESN